MSLSKDVRGRHQASLLGEVRPVHQQRGGSGQPAEGPGRPGGSEGRAEDADRRPRRFVMMIPDHLLPAGVPNLGVRPATSADQVCSPPLCCTSGFPKFPKTSNDLAGVLDPFVKKDGGCFLLLLKEKCVAQCSKLYFPDM